MKLENMMVRISSQMIGFTCFDLFVVDRKAVYQVCLLWFKEMIVSIKFYSWLDFIRCVCVLYASSSTCSED